MSARNLLHARGVSPAVHRVLVLFVAACSAPAAPPAAKPIPVPPPPVEARTCLHAAEGIELGTRSIRPPPADPDIPEADERKTFIRAIRDRCDLDAWTPESRACFAAMQPSDFVECVTMIEQASREKVFAALGGGAGDDRTTLTIATARLASLSVGVDECERFVAGVVSFLRCEAVPVEQRARLGAETADFWSLPTKGLPQDAQRRIAAECKRSLDSLHHHAKAAGCLP